MRGLGGAGRGLLGMELLRLTCLTSFLATDMQRVEVEMAWWMDLRGRETRW